MPYFQPFPSITYSLDNENQQFKQVKNIFARVKLLKEVLDNADMFYTYEMKESDTPEIIASKFYDSPEKHWAVLLINDIIDPQWEWPMDQRTMIKFIESKYSANAAVGETGVYWSKNNIKNYFIIQTRTLSSGSITIDKTETDANTYANTST